VCVLSQGEEHNVWGNAPKKSNSATCAHFHKRARCASKPNIFLFFKNFWGVKIAIFLVFDEICKKFTKNYKNCKKITKNIKSLQKIIKNYKKL